MILPKKIVALLSALVAAAGMTVLAQPAAAQELRWAFQGEIHSMDPYSLNETFSIGTLGNVFEGLVRRAPDLKTEPALAEKWEILSANHWRFYLRKGVKFRF